ncbi:MAG: hypothetical protein HFE63_03680 [Clostridiales bacterium]|nr:hypothetical protein [Clostridiales bacterium]
MIFDKKIYKTTLSALILAALVCCKVPYLGSLMTPVSADSEPIIAPSATAAAPTKALTFPDVKDGDWYYADVMKLAEAGILNGYPDGLFYPEQEITIAEFIKIVICTEGDVPDSAILFPDNWAAKYIDAAYQRGIITDTDLKSGFDPDAPITRSAMTKMMILALGIEPARIDDPFTDISDMYASTAYNEYLLRGYLMPDYSRIYNGVGNAARSEAAAIAVRMIAYRNDSYSYKRDAILQNASENPLNSELELIDLFYILNREFITEFTFTTNVPYDKWTSYYLHSNVINLEYFYSSGVSIDAYSNGRYTLKLQFDMDIDSYKSLHTLAEEKADKIIESIITPQMSDMDRVKAIHDYIVLNCAYDYENYLAGTIPYESYTAYGALCNKTAICQGYAASFNLLCERVGIRSVAIGGYPPNSNIDHVWNMVLINGQIFYIDTTHDDPVPDRKGMVSYRYFCLTESEMTSLGYVWDKTCSNLKYFY